MQFKIYLNQGKAIEWDLNLTEAGIFSYLYELPSWAEPRAVEGFFGTPFYWCSKTKLVKEFPLITKKVDTIYKVLKSLEKKGLIEYKFTDGKDFVRLTKKGSTWNFREESEKNPSELGKKSENVSEKNPTYSNSINDSNTIDKAPAAKTIPERRKEFLNKILQFAIDNPGKYPFLLYRDFATYWTTPEANKKTPKHRFETEKFFHLGRRLGMWFQNSKPFVLTEQWNKQKDLGTLSELFKPLIND